MTNSAAETGSILASALTFWVVAVSPAFAGPPARAIDFNRDVRPILSDNCFQCHGPDENKREADLRLDVKTGAFAVRDGAAIIAPGKPDVSELYRRIASPDAAERMPPSDSGRKLTPKEIVVVRRWIAQGANWSEHWSFVAPKRPAPPDVADPEIERRIQNPIDNFVFARLAREGMQPSLEADRETLIRRVTLDLTGLPPTPEEIDRFVSDDRPGAYERLVDRLPASPRYGERMAARWLDAARYADTSGYQNDGPREMWRWRDWVIDAYNANTPFDRFTIEQLAGDLLPDATLDQLIATGFNRNHRGNAEGGIIPEEYQVEYVVDRVDTTATVWLGLTMGCARCHDHKFDAVTQRDFYRMFAYFNNIPENGRAIKEGNSPPYVKAPTRDQHLEYLRALGEFERAADEFDKMKREREKQQKEWEQEIRRLPKHQQAGASLDWQPERDLLVHLPLDGSLHALTANKASRDRKGPHTDSDASFQALPDGRGSPSRRKGASTSRSESIWTAGRIDKAVRLDGRRYIDAGDRAKFGYFDKFTVAMWIRPEKSTGTLVSRMTDSARADGWYVRLEDGRLQVNLVKRWLDDAIRVETKTRLPLKRWTHVAVRYDGSRVAKGIDVSIDGRSTPLTVQLDALNQSFANDQPLRIGAGGGADNVFRGAIDDVRIYARRLNDVDLLSVPESVAEIVETPPDQRSPVQQKKLYRAFVEYYAPVHIRESWDRLYALREKRRRLYEEFPTVMIMQEMQSPRETHVLKRGEYDKPGERVTTGVSDSLPPLPDGAPQNRLGLASWIVDESNPLTARVAVNRYWQMYFGTGLVRTVEDLGSQGERPSHPELLDWLATEFVRTGWDVKCMQRLIVTSATYRQTSRTTPELRERDPDNRLLARGPRLRLSAEMIRDQALHASGLLVERLGGPSVKPYQPAGLWKEIATVGEYEQDHGPSLYRRSLYTYWKRTVSPPAMVAFDAATRETCIVRESRTNTPLQALALLNDVTYVEAARKLAERVMKDADASPTARIRRAFRLVLGRIPNKVELRILTGGFNAHLEEYRRNPSSAEKLLSAGESPREASLKSDEQAAYTAVAGLILNLDEAITKE